MEDKEKTLQEQNAPLKNNDKAFVQVGANGEPVIPQQSGVKGVKNEEQWQDDRTTNLDKR